MVLNGMDMLNRLPPFMRKSGVYKAIFEADASQLAARELSVEDFVLQMSVDTATWALSIYEAELGLPVSLDKPIGERRSMIKAKDRGTGKVDAALIKAVADSYSNGDVSVSFSASRLTITFTSVVGIPPNIPDLQFAIEEIKPAHLAVMYVFLFNIYSQLTVYTHALLATRTHEQLRSGPLP